MKRRLNLNPHAGRFLAAISLLLVLGPAALWVIGRLLAAAGRGGLAAAALRLAKASVAASLVLLGGFVLLVVVEQVQDRLYDRAYRRQLARKLAAPGGVYECQYCGNRRLAAGDRRCEVCGRELT